MSGNFGCGVMFLVMSMSLIGGNGWGAATDRLRGPTKALARSADAIPFIVGIWTFPRCGITVIAMSSRGNSSPI